MNRLDAPENEIPAETLEAFVMLGQRLAAQMVEANSRIILNRERSGVRPRGEP